MSLFNAGFHLVKAAANAGVRHQQGVAAESQAAWAAQRAGRPEVITRPTMYVTPGTRKWPANQTFSFMYPCTVCDWKVTREDGDPSTQRASVELVENHYENAHGQRVRIKLVESLTIMRPVPVPAKMPAVVGSPPTRPKTEVEHTQSRVVEQMKNLKELRELGLITPTEFDRKKTELLDRM